MRVSGVRFPGFLILCMAVVLAPLAAVDVNALYNAAETALYDDGDYELVITTGS